MNQHSLHESTLQKLFSKICPITKIIAIAVMRRHSATSRRHQPAESEVHYMTASAVKSRKEFGKTLAVDITHRLRQDIVACRLKPGEPLKFDALKLAFGASFTTLREALTSLTADGLVVAEEQRGFRVAPVTSDDLIDITQTRILIEIELLSRSITNGGDDWEIAVMSTLHRLGRIEERLPGNHVENPEWQIAHRQFHEALVSCGRSPTLFGIRASLFERAERYRNLSAMFRPQPRDKVGEHRAIMQAAIARDTNLATSLIDQHIRSTSDNVVKYASHLLTES
ncbi:GntR family transcriptional regulator [Tardiphaga sp. 709]|uniref:GntR family transcriptional regulator n=1 Tax=unclassified Tardiphaga TaxID=2631404 RepID=UPI0028E3017B|nr:FCD domain-containing protein [Tardiphaga sp. 709]WNV11087.1 FCD domain-containing protein [Tardiphaga sp. 709]